MSGFLRMESYFLMRDVEGSKNWSGCLQQDLVHPYHTDPYQEKNQKGSYKAYLGQWSWGQGSKDQKLDPNGLAYWNDMGE